MVGDALAAGDSVYETDDDLELVGAALPFGLKLTESLLAQSPNHRGLLLTACRGFVLYSYAFVDYAAAMAADEDLDRARELRARARRLYLRALQYGIRGLERSYPRHRRSVSNRSAVRRIRASSNDDVVPSCIGRPRHSVWRSRWRRTTPCCSHGCRRCRRCSIGHSRSTKLGRRRTARAQGGAGRCGAGRR